MTVLVGVLAHYKTEQDQADQTAQKGEVQKCAEDWECAPPVFLEQPDEAQNGADK